MFGALIVGAVLVSAVSKWIAFTTNLDVLFAVGLLLLTWASISMFAGRAVWLERDRPGGHGSQRESGDGSRP